MNPPPVPTDEYVNNLWQSVKAGRITWDELRQLQAESMPKCAAHDKPSNVRIGREPFCEDCIRERRHVK